MIRSKSTGILYPRSRYVQNQDVFSSQERDRSRRGAKSSHALRANHFSVLFQPKEGQELESNASSLSETQQSLSQILNSVHLNKEQLSSQINLLMSISVLKYGSLIFFRKIKNS
jgi:hypothetical protein